MCQIEHLLSYNAILDAIVVWWITIHAHTHTYGDFSESTINLMHMFLLCGGWSEHANSTRKDPAWPKQWAKCLLTLDYACVECYFPVLHLHPVLEAWWVTTGPISVPALAGGNRGITEMKQEFCIYVQLCSHKALMHRETTVQWYCIVITMNVSRCHDGRTKCSVTEGILTY